MQYTLKQAEAALAQYSHAYGVISVRDSINKAVRALADMSGWECLRKVLRFFSAGPCFTLPQGYAGLVRVCVNGRPASLHGTDFSFVHSGPGDLINPPHGFSPVDPADIRDIGEYPLYVIPTKPFRLFAMTDARGVDESGASTEPAITVKGIDSTGKIVVKCIPMQLAPKYSKHTGELESGVDPCDAVISVDTIFSTVTEVVIDSSATDYITLYAEDYATSIRYMVATYHPSVLAPTFRHYEITGTHPGPKNILAEVRLDPLPLIRDTDVLPIDTLEPIEWMIMADWKLKASEVDAAQKYHQLAAQWMKAKEVTNNTVQTSIVINNRLAGSMFEVSGDAWNI